MINYSKLKLKIDKIIKYLKMRDIIILILLSIITICLLKIAFCGIYVRTDTYIPSTIDVNVVNTPDVRVSNN